MTAALAHRGPDGDGVWSSADGRCHFGHRRLSILDLSDAAAQPMLDAAGRIAVTFNGEIYNFRDLRTELEAEGVRFRSSGDTEVLVEGFARHGAAFFRKVDGMFAAAFFDTVTGTLTLVRDRVGEKPLYWAPLPDGIAFASELAPLLDVPGVDVALSPGGIAHYLVLRYVPAPHTIVEGVRKLGPGRTLEIAPTGAMSEARYFSWRISPDATVAPDRFEQYCDQLEAELVQSLRQRLNADVPVGVFLSSGIDSALACALLRRRLRVPVRSYCIGFEGDPESEHPRAREIAEYLDTEHRDHVFGAADYAGTASGIALEMDEPNGDRSCVPVHLLSRFARQDVTVAISGDGGDELYGGYGRYPPFVAAMADPAADPAADPVAAVRLYHTRFLPVFDPSLVERILPEGWKAVEDTFAGWAAAFHEPRRPVLHGLRLLDMHGYLPGAVLAKVDRMSMRHGLEVRSPFFAPPVLARAAAAPLEFCISGDTTKVALRAILARHLPMRLIRPDKKGFGMPPSVLQGNQAAVRQDLRAAMDGLIRTRFFQERPAVLQAMLQPVSRNMNALWALIVLGRWCARFPGRF
jgi:asparagine synthase (glutamine-hydrolysing)